MKPDVLNEDELQKGYAMVRNEVMAKICQAESIKGMPIDIVDQIINGTIKIIHCEDLIQQARQEAARELFEKIEKHYGMYLDGKLIEISIIPENWQSLKSRCLNEQTE
jgi:hypothetical protein